ncbi:MAG: Gfo/Idh/MocA family oxidoreductase [Bacteroidota bacterium]
MPPFNINRRKFLHTASASLALSYLGIPGLDIIYPVRKRKVGVIGTGWYGKNDIFRLIQVADVDVVALCDVDQKQLEEAANLIMQRLKTDKKPQLYNDYQALLNKHELDIVLIGTPDHWHALQAIAAIEAGADVYLQKPTSVDIQESEAILAAARKHNRVVQVGTQRRSTPHLMEAKKRFVDSGMLGDVAQVELSCYYHMRGRTSPPVQPVPDYFDYENWAGPAPKRPFDGMPHGRWRHFMEYSNGIMGDMCVHMLDSARWMLDLGYPRRVSSTGGIFVDKKSSANIADTQNALFEFDELNCVWQHRTWGKASDTEYPWAFIIYGDAGTLKADVRKYEFIPQGKGKAVKGEALYEKEKFPEDVNEKRIELHAAPATRRHFLDFLKAIDERSKPVADIEQGHISTVSCIAANISMELGGRPLQYDPVKKQFHKDRLANKYLSRSYRKGWTHPA